MKLCSDDHAFTTLARALLSPAGSGGAALIVARQASRRCSTVLGSRISAATRAQLTSSYTAVPRGGSSHTAVPRGGSSYTAVPRGGEQS